MSKKEYSNYVIQHILEVGTNEHKENLLMNFIKPKFIELSCDQFARQITNNILTINFKIKLLIILVMSQKKQLYFQIAFIEKKYGIH